MRRRAGWPRRRSRSPLGRRSLAVTMLLAALVALRWWQQQNQPPPAPPGQEEYIVQRVVDGDTLLLADDVRVRLIGVDTPETVKPNHPVERGGPEATEFTRHFVSGARVRLQFDQQRKDRFDRLLAYVWVGDRMLNEELIRAGWAKAEMQYHYSAEMKARFRQAEQEARSAGRGIWAP